MRLHWQTQKAFVFGTFEIEVTRAIQRVVRPGWTVVDIGAHIGYETLLLAQQVGPKGRIFAFEPLARQLSRAHGKYQPKRMPKYNG